MTLEDDLLAARQAYLKADTKRVAAQAEVAALKERLAGVTAERDAAVLALPPAAQVEKWKAAEAREKGLRDWLRVIAFHAVKARMKGEACPWHGDNCTVVLQSWAEGALHGETLDPALIDGLPNPSAALAQPAAPQAAGPSAPEWTAVQERMTWEFLIADSMRAATDRKEEIVAKTSLAEWKALTSALRTLPKQIESARQWIRDGKSTEITNAGPSAESPAREEVPDGLNDQSRPVLPVTEPGTAEQPAAAPAADRAEDLDALDPCWCGDQALGARTATHTDTKWVMHRREMCGARGRPPNATDAEWAHVEDRRAKVSLSLASDTKRGAR